MGFNTTNFNEGVFGGAPSPAPQTMCIPFGPGPGSIAYQALRLTGQLNPGSQPAPELLADALFECNMMIDEWGANELDQYFIDDRYFAINVSQQSYTLGPTGTFNTDINGNPLTYRPQRIVGANLILLTGGGGNASSVRIPIRIVDVFDWADIPVPQVTTSVITTMYVQTTKDNVTLWMFPFPTLGNQIEFFMWPGFPQFASPTACFDAPPAWQSFMVYSLAERLLLLNTKDLPLTVGRRQDRYALINKRKIEAQFLVWGSNAPTPKLTPDLAIRGVGTEGAPFNYLYGDYSQ